MRAILLPVNRRRTRFASWLVLLSLFFGQLAIAAYACPLVDGTPAPSGQSAEISTPCADMASGSSPDPSALCFEHCKADQQLVDTHPDVDPGASPLLFVYFANVPATAAALDLRVDTLFVRATSPPILASTSRLRI